MFIFPTDSVFVFPFYLFSLPHHFLSASGVFTLRTPIKTNFVSLFILYDGHIYFFNLLSTRDCCPEMSEFAIKPNIIMTCALKNVLLIEKSFL